MQFLVDAGVNPVVRNADGFTALDFAEHAEQRGAAEQLRKAIGLTVGGGWWGCEQGMVEVVEDGVLAGSHPRAPQTPRCSAWRGG